MKEIDQTEFGSKEGNCFSACVAMILGLELEDVPFFMEPGDWESRFRKFLSKHGYWPAFLPVGDPNAPLRAQLGLHILSGKSPRGDWLHSVVAKGRKILHDPHPSRLGLETCFDIVLIAKG